MNDLCVDVGYRSLIKHGEQLCGDMVQLIREDDTTILVLADGLGSGVKANILATLTSKILSTMIAAGMSVEECVSTVVSTLPVCKERGIAYATFTIIKISDNTYADVFQYDNPKMILMRNGKSTDYMVNERTISGKTILESHILLEPDDVFVAMSDGTIYAGVEKTLNYGWQRENIVEYLESHFNSSLSADAVTALIVDACNDLYLNEPGDDTTVASIRIRRRNPVNFLFGPPTSPKDVNKMMAMFFAKAGKHIVSGGTTSGLTAKYLGKDLETSIDYIDEEIPPIAKIDDVDLVTEGVITVSRVVEYANDFIGENKLCAQWREKKDGASKIAQILLDEATDINFYVGRAVNPAHQNPNLPIGFNIKMQLVKELSEALKKMGKTINVSYF